MKTTIYLSGPIKNTDDGGVGWRRDVQEGWPEFDYIDPSDKPDNLWFVPDNKYNEDIQEEAEISDMEIILDSELVARDIDSIIDSDVVLVGWSPSESGVGTQMEMRIAHYELDTPVCLWNRDRIEYWELSPWIRHHSDFVAPYPGECIDWIRGYGLEG